MRRQFEGSPKSNDSGYIIVTVALLIVVLVGMVALAVDVGVFLDARTTAQNIADASALSGAFSFVVNPTSPQPATAEEYALATSVGREILGTPLVASDVAVDVDVANQLVTVTIQRNEPSYFARVLDVFDATVGVQAQAEAGTEAVGSNCTKPWMLPNTVLLPPGSSACDACPGSPTYSPALGAQVLISGGVITPFAESQRGVRFTIKPQQPVNALAPGQFYAIQVSDGSGADVYRENIGTCSGEVFCSACYDVEPGNMVGPTLQGVRDLTGDPADTFNAGGFCYDPGCRDTSPSLVVVPIWDVCAGISGTGGCQSSGFCPDGKFSDSGANITVRVIGFGLIFVEGLQGNNIVARLIDVKTCGAGAGGGGGGGAPPAPFSVPIRLVRTES